MLDCLLDKWPSFPVTGTLVWNDVALHVASEFSLSSLTDSLQDWSLYVLLLTKLTPVAFTQWHCYFRHLSHFSPTYRYVPNYHHHMVTVSTQESARYFAPNTDDTITTALIWVFIYLHAAYTTYLWGSRLHFLSSRHQTIDIKHWTWWAVQQTDDVQTWSGNRPQMLSCIYNAVPKWVPLDWSEFHLSTHSAEMRAVNKLQVATINDKHISFHHLCNGSTSTDKLAIKTKKVYFIIYFSI